MGVVFQSLFPFGDPLSGKKRQSHRHLWKRRRPADVGTPAAPFAGFLEPLIARMAQPVVKTILRSEPLAHLDYQIESKVKNEGLRLFWQRHRLPGQPEAVIASPRPRGYRTTSKRRAVLHGDTFYLMLSEKERLPRKSAFRPSRLEPPEHERLYRFLHLKLSQPPFRLVANHLNHLIIRGSYAERVLIFNVNTLNGPLIRKLKILAGHLQKLPEPVAAVFVYPDPSRSDYYLENRRQANMIHIKKLYGPDQLMVSCDGCRYRFPPTSFSQINESMVPVMLNLARELLAPETGHHLLDLYCGYGLFSHFLAPDFRQVLGIDAEGPAIRAAEANRRLNAGSSRTTFRSHRITETYLDGLPSAMAPETILLDPPRQGPEAGVIAALARRHPQMVLHIFCGVDQMPIFLKAWQASGYRVHRIVPLDMFPGTTNLEILILLMPNG
jgi:tRNA/tmRNA/rRNA uracil-C5-methylase (TrmA/RlmC/RlmD family)